MPWRIPRFKMKTVDRVWFLSHCEWIFANRQRLKDKPCTEFVITGFIINSFGCPYYGYTPIITKELWDLCQYQKALKVGNLSKHTEKPFIFRGLIRCGITNKQCVCELKKKIFSYVVCWKDDKTRLYIREEELIRHIGSILNRIRLPNDVVIELQKELKSSKSSERKFYAQEIKKLREEQDKLKEKLNNLFDLRLDGELDRETFDTKRNEIQVKLNRLKNKVTAHEKADNSFDETILGLLDIATQAGNIFEKSQNLELKRLLL